MRGREGPGPDRPHSVAFAAVCLQILWIEDQLQLACLERFTFTFKPLGHKKFRVENELQITVCNEASSRARGRRTATSECADWYFPQTAVAEDASISSCWRRSMNLMIFVAFYHECRPHQARCDNAISLIYE